MTKRCSSLVQFASRAAILKYYCAVALHSCILLPPVGNSSNHQYHCCKLTRQSRCISKFISISKFSFDAPSCIYKLHIFSSFNILSFQLISSYIFSDICHCKVQIYLNWYKIIKYVQTTPPIPQSNDALIVKNPQAVNFTFNLDT